MPENRKIIIDNKAFDVDGYLQSRQVYFLLDGKEIGFDQVKKVLRGTGRKEYDYHKNNTAKEIFEGDIINFFDDRCNLLSGEVVWDEKRLQWMIECDRNMSGWVEYRLCDAGTPSIMQRAFE